jgi:hypothetical protein
VTLNIQGEDLRRFAGRLETKYDLIFHDPFSPRKVPELWTLDIFEKYYRALNAQQGMLLTYSCAGAVRGGLLKAGFSVFQTESLGHRRGGTLAWTVKNCAAPSDFAQNLSGIDIKRLRGASGVPFRDTGFNADRIDIMTRRVYEQNRLQGLVKPQDG